MLNKRNSEFNDDHHNLTGTHSGHPACVYIILNFSICQMLFWTGMHYVLIIALVMEFALAMDPVIVTMAGQA